MYRELRCTLCRSRLEKIGNNLVCSNEGISYEIRDAIPLMWKAEFNDTRAVKARILREWEFSKNLVANIIDGDLHPSLAGLKAEEYYLRHTGRNYAAKMMDQQVFDALFKMLPNISGMKILNIGCGGGKDAEWLIAQGVKDIVCTDISPDFMGMARRRLHNQEIQPRYYFQANAESLPVADDSFDAVFFGAVLHHIPRPFMALTEAARIAPIVIACSEPSDMRIFGPILKWIRWSTEYGGLIPHRFNPTRLKEYMHGLGYDAKIQTDFTWFPLGLFKPFSNNKPFVDAYYSFLRLMNLLFGYYGHGFNMVAQRMVTKIKDEDSIS